MFLLDGCEFYTYNFCVVLLNCILLNLFPLFMFMFMFVFVHACIKSTKCSFLSSIIVHFSSFDFQFCYLKNLIEVQAKFMSKD